MFSGACHCNTGDHTVMRIAGHSYSYSFSYTYKPR